MPPWFFLPFESKVKRSNREGQPIPIFRIGIGYVSPIIPGPAKHNSGKEYPTWK